MMTLTDQTENRISLPQPAQRIVSLVPSLTETLACLNLENEVIAITRFCVHPSHWHKTKPRVGGTKKLHLERIQALKPDLILANKEENTKDEIEFLKNKFNVYVSDVKTLEDALQMIEHLGLLTGRQQQAVVLTNQICQQFEKLQKAISTQPLLKCIYLIWQKPFMTIGGDTFIHHILTCAGMYNCFGHQLRYPVVEEETLCSTEADVVFLPSEPYPFKFRHQQELHSLFPKALIRLVDGTYFSWYGCRLRFAPDYLMNLRASLYTDT
jgi:ABC-type Fe3+-hydroxamate transport system substrate-binding protein